MVRYGYRVFLRHVIIEEVRSKKQKDPFFLNIPGRDIKTLIAVF